MMKMTNPWKRKKTSSRTNITISAVLFALVPLPLALAGTPAGPPAAPVAAASPQVGAPQAGPTIGGSSPLQNGPVNRGPIQRVADGKVIGKADAPMSGAIVYLKDSKALAVKTFITGDDGRFHFGQLGQNTDYELWAESNGSRSKSKTISSFDSRNNYNFTLKVDTAK
jgi:hypothetical protein